METERPIKKVKLAKNAEDDKVVNADGKRILKNIFVVPPVSVLNSNSREWKKRKSEWMFMKGISDPLKDESITKNMMTRLINRNKDIKSLFDPVLAEVMYMWFSAEKDVVFDPFAHDIVRGVVAYHLSRLYVGINKDVAKVESFNDSIEEASEIYCDITRIPHWFGPGLTGGKVDFIFTCVAYDDLNPTSDGVVSRASYDEYEKTIANALTRLKFDRFAVLVISDGHNDINRCAGLPRRTIEIFEKNNCFLYNEAVYVQNNLLPIMQAHRSMSTCRRPPVMHKQIFVFIKGSNNAAIERLPSFAGKKTDEAE